MACQVVSPCPGVVPSMPLVRLSTKKDMEGIKTSPSRGRRCRAKRTRDQLWQKSRWVYKLAESEDEADGGKLWDGLGMVHKLHKKEICDYGEAGKVCPTEGGDGAFQPRSWTDMADPREVKSVRVEKVDPEEAAPSDALQAVCGVRNVEATCEAELDSAPEQFPYSIGKKEEKENEMDREGGRCELCYTWMKYQGGICEECWIIDEEEREESKDAEDMMWQQLGRGKSEYDKGNFQDALMAWNRSLQAVDYLLETNHYMDKPEHVLGEILETEVKLHVNMAQGYLKIEEWNKALASACDALECDPQNIKALYRMASAQMQLMNFQEAKDTLYRLLQIDPGSAAAKQMLAENKRMAQIRARESRKSHTPG